MASRLHKGQYSGKITDQQSADGLLVGITSYSVDGCNPDFHCHENPHLILLLNGGNVYNSPRKSTEKTAGDMLFYHSGEIHQTLPGTAFSKCINLEVEQDFLSDFHISEQMLQRAVVGTNAKFLVLKMYKELLANDQLTHASIQLLFLGLVEKEPKGTTVKPAWLARLEALLQDEWDTVPNLDTLSKAVDVHPVTISKYFTKHMGCTLGEYLRKIKVEKSMGFIRGGQDSLTEVATRCGFADQSHFIRNFKAYTGLLPKEFKAL